jgi:hypothetical protein
MRDGQAVAGSQETYRVPAFGQHTFALDVTAPSGTGDYLLVAEAKSASGSTVSRRKVRVE